LQDLAQHQVADDDFRRAENLSQAPDVR
jgi:hypothetical protein